MKLYYYKEIYGLLVGERPWTFFNMSAPQEEGLAVAVSEDNTDDTSPENGQVICCLKL